MPLPSCQGPLVRWPRARASRLAAASPLAHAARLAGEVQFHVLRAFEVRGRTAVVAAENHQRPAGELVPVERLQNPADVLVQFLDVIAVKSRLAGAAKTRGGRDVGVGHHGREIQEERAFAVFLDEMQRLAQQRFADLIVHARLGQTLGKIATVDDAKRLPRLAPHDVVVLDEDAVGIVVVLWHTEVVIETHLQRPGDGQLVPVRAVAQMPFADGRRTIALGFEQRGDVHPVLLEVVVVALPVQPPRIAAREQSIARRRTDRPGRMRVGEPYAVAGEPVHVRRLDLRRTVASDVAVAKIIREDDNDVRLA